MSRKIAVEPKYTDPRPLVERSITEHERTKRILRSVTVNLAESPLAWLHARSLVTDRQLLAGEMLRSDYEAAAMAPRITMNWDNLSLSRNRRSAPAMMEGSERILSAKDRFDCAMADLGRDLADIAWRVICAGEGVPLAERTLAWPARSGKLVLRIALDRLAEYYRLPG